MEKKKKKYKKRLPLVVQPVGAPPKYVTSYPSKAYKLALLGCTIKEMGEIFGVTEETMFQWMEKYPKLSESIKAGRSDADANVADRLYQKAMGYSHDSEEIKVVSDGMGIGSSVVRVPVKKHYPPDSTAAIFWLKNRQPAKWREKQEIEHSGNGLAGPFQVQIIPPSED